MAKWICLSWDTFSESSRPILRERHKRLFPSVSVIYHVVHRDKAASAGYSCCYNQEYIIYYVLFLQCSSTCTLRPALVLIY